MEPLQTDLARDRQKNNNQPPSDGDKTNKAARSAWYEIILAGVCGMLGQICICMAYELFRFWVRKTSLEEIYKDVFLKGVVIGDLIVFGILTATYLYITLRVSENIKSETLKKMGYTLCLVPLVVLLIMGANGLYHNLANLPAISATVFAPAPAPTASAISAITLNHGEAVEYRLENGRSTPWITTPTGVDYNINIKKGTPFKIVFDNGHEARYVSGNNRLPDLRGRRFKVINLGNNPEKVTVSGV